MEVERMLILEEHDLEGYIKDEINEPKGDNLSNNQTQEIYDQRQEDHC